jgi:serine/threonine protein kinase
LGTGNFSRVFRGYQQCLKRSVAIKIANTTTNTDDFKLMLTEIKIMIYAGCHENIIKFIGASTALIRDSKNILES